MTTLEIQAVEPVIEMIEIASISRDVVVRAKGAARATVREYTRAMAGGAVFPPIVVYRDSKGALQLSDGAHRLEAALANGATTIAAEVRTGSRKDCLVHAVGSARTHGLRFTTADKRKAIELLVGNFPKWSARKIAEACGVDHKTVSATMARLAAPAGEIPQAAASTNGAGAEPASPEPVDPLAKSVTQFRKLLGTIADEQRSAFGDQVLAILSEARA